MLFSLLTALVLSSAPAPAAVETGDAASLDRNFVCPESLPTVEAKMAALADFIGMASKVAPNISVPNLLQLRRSLLEKHGCRETLQRMAEDDARILAGDVADQAWLVIGSGPTQQLSISTSYFKPYSDPRSPTVHAIETFVKLDLREPGETEGTHVVFDQVISRMVYYCGQNSYAQIESDYFLGGQQVLKDPSRGTQVGSQTVYDVEDVVENTPNNVAAKWACQASPGVVASAAPPSLG